MARRGKREAGKERYAALQPCPPAKQPAQLARPATHLEPFLVGGGLGGRQHLHKALAAKAARAKAAGRWAGKGREGSGDTGWLRG